jgi:hypothetical protein
MWLDWRKVGPNNVSTSVSVNKISQGVGEILAIRTPPPFHLNNN